METLEPRLLLSGAAGDPGTVAPLDSPSPITLTSTTATWVSQINPNTNYGSQGTLLAGADLNTWRDEATYVAFDMGGLPSGAQVTAATLRMYCTQSLGYALTTYAHAPSVAWDENSLTWTNRPQAFMSIGPAAWSVATDVGHQGWFTWDVTAAATRWQSGEWPNNGLLLDGTVLGYYMQVTFASDDDPTPANRPQLVVSYTFDRPTITSFELDSGIGVANSRSVALDGAFDNNPTEYLASEYADFHDAAWRALPASGPPKFTLSAGDGQHTVYLKVRNSLGECDAPASATIDEQAADAPAPTVTIAPVTPSPRDTTVAGVTITFSEPVVGFVLADLALSRDGTNVPLGTATLGSADGGRTWTLGGLAGLTGTAGSYTLTLAAAGSAIVDAAGDPPADGAATTWAANFAPVLDTGGADLPLAAIDEDADNPGTLVADILAGTGGDTITDGDAGALEGIAVVGYAGGSAVDQGKWQYNLGGAGWTDFGSVWAAASRLLRDTDRIRFVPAADFNGTPAVRLKFCAWDQTSGAPGGTADLRAAGAVGGLTAYSSAQANLVITVRPVNDRPVALDMTVTVPMNDSGAMFPNVRDVETTWQNMTFNVPARSAHGTLTAIGGGMVNYQPDPGYAGVDSYQFTATDDGDPAGSHGGGGDLTSNPATVTIDVGWETPLDSHGTATFYDAGQNLMTVALTGGGTGNLWFGQSPGSLPGQDVARIVLDGTGPDSVLTITTGGPGTATTIGGIQVLGNGSLGAITGKTTSLNGAITVPGLLGAVTLDDALAGSSIDVNAGLLSPGGTRLTLSFDRVTDTSVNTHGEPIGSITATEWANTPAGGLEQIAAPWIGAITTLGRKANPRAVLASEAVAGDFSVDLALSGVGAPARTPTLGTVKIAGAVHGGTWSVTGDAAAITIAGAAEDWKLQGPGAAGAGLRTVKALTLGDVRNGTILADGALPAVKALNWDGGAIAADSLVSLSITGRKAAPGVPALPGDFRNADLTLRANAAPGAGKTTMTALGSAAIAGSLVNSTWSVDMNVQAIQAGGSVSGWTLAGANDGDAVNLLGVWWLNLGDVADASVTVTTAQFNVTNAKGQVTQVTAGGLLRGIRAVRWAAGSIEADSITSLWITGQGPTASAPGVPGDFGAAVTLHGQNLCGRPTTAWGVTVAHDLTGSLWQVTGSITTLVVARTARNSTVRTSGSITNVWLGASNGSQFLAGVTSAQLDAAQVTSADLDPTGLATIGMVAVKGWPTPAGAPIPDFLTDSSFLAPRLGTVSVLNGDNTWDLYALAGTAGLRIKSVSVKDARAPKDAAKNWTWTPARNVPLAAGGAARQIL